MSETDLMTVQECAKSLTGFEELAIQRAFGKDLSELSSTLVPRALIFILSRREGAKDPDAYRMAMECPLGDLEDNFAAIEVDEGKATSPTEGSRTS